MPVARTRPFVSCILVTCDRRPFFAQALRCYAAQQYQPRELIVVDDGEQHVEPWCKGLSGVTYIRLPGRTPTGTKLNIGIRAARGDILQKLDDDDYYGRQFLTTAVRHLVRQHDSRTLVAWCCFAVLITGDPVLHYSGHGWQAGGTLCFRRTLWLEREFRDVFVSSDSWFIRDHQPPIARVCAPDQYMLVRHGGNTWRRIKGYDSVEAYFRGRRFPKTMRQLVGNAHARFYQPLMDGNQTA